jgi:pyruvate dehydrogenase E2 component (dihydrolipoamide acetyltransferase)
MADLKPALVPDIGNYTDVPVIEILVKVGDSVVKDQGLLTLESDKATMEVPAPFAGVVRELKVKLGDRVGEGATVVMIEVGAGPISLADQAKRQTSAAAAKPAPVVEAPVVQAAPAAPAAVAPAAVAVAPAPVATSASTPAPAAIVASEGDPAHASPGVRLFARELGVDLARVTAGTGRKGRITKEDVQNFVKGVLSQPASAAAAPSGAGGLQLLPWPKVDFAKFGPVEVKPLSRINKIAGQNLARNWAMIPHVTQFDEADVTEMEAFRKKLGEESKDLKLTPLVFLIKAVVAALKKFPRFNSSLEGDNLVYKQYFHIGIAVDTPDGLVVPVIRDCDQKGLLALAKEMGEISVKAREKKLGPGDMTGGCFSISSLGGIGGTGFTPIVNAPEVAILGVSKSRMQPVWNGSSFDPRLMLPLSLSYDHRVIDGAEAARFAAYLAQQLADVRRLLL